LSLLVTIRSSFAVNQQAGARWSLPENPAALQRFLVTLPIFGCPYHEIRLRERNEIAITAGAILVVAEEFNEHGLDRACGDRLTCRSA
jgi:hypothetical protein